MSDTIEVINGDSIEIYNGNDTIEVINGGNTIEISNEECNIDIINGDVIEITQESDNIEVVNDTGIIEITNEVVMVGQKSLTPINYLGSDLSGSQGTGRTLTVSSSPVIIFLERGMLHPSLDFNILLSVITFNVFIADTMRLTIYS